MMRLHNKLKTVTSDSMKKILLYCLWFSTIATAVSAQQNSLLKLWYTQPAKQWVEALPVGNGRLGAMIYGDPSKELIQLNENTVWAGSPYRNDNPDAREALPEVRNLIFEGSHWRSFAPLSTPCAMAESTRSFCRAETIGPMETPKSMPYPTTTCLAASTSRPRSFL